MKRQKLIGMTFTFLILLFSLESEPLKAFYNHFESSEALLEEESKEIAPIQSLTRSEILSDKEGRISKDFKISQGLYWRVGFWFDVYTKYGSSEHVIHHRKYPWIVYNVVDNRPIYKRYKKYLVNRRDARRNLYLQKKKIRKSLKALSLGKPKSSFNKLDRKLVQLLKSVPGSRQKVYHEAARSVRSQQGIKDQLILGLAMSNQYMDYIEKHLEEKNLPKELARIPFVESGFNLKATSRIGASGIWQIMPHIGKSAMMQVDKKIDERRSPVKSTFVAADLLKFNYKVLNRWPLAVTAYNHGVGSMRRATRKVKSKNLGAIIMKYKSPSFKFASANFYASFLGVLYAEKYQRELFGDIKKDAPVEFDIVSLKKNYNLKMISALTSVSRETLLAFNPDIRVSSKTKEIILPKGFQIILPAGIFSYLDAHLVFSNKVIRNDNQVI